MALENESPSETQDNIADTVAAALDAADKAAEAEGLLDDGVSEEGAGEATDTGEPEGGSDEGEGEAGTEPTGDGESDEGDTGDEETAGDGDTEGAGEEASAGDEEAGEGEAIEYPEPWDPQYREDFEAMPPRMQQFLVERHKSMEADYTRKNMEIADLRREYEPVDQIMNAFMPAMKQLGISKGEMIRRWAQTESYLNTQPELVIKQLAEYYGVDLAALPYAQPTGYNDGSEYQDGAVNPQVQTLQQQVNNLEYQNNLQMLNAFADEVDENGNKVRPYFDDVLPDMMEDYQLQRAAGRNPDLKELYEQACWKNTSVREKMLAQQKNAGSTATSDDAAAKAEAERKAKEARQKAAQARKASKSVSGQSGSSVEPKQDFDSVEAAVKAAFDKH